MHVVCALCARLLQMMVVLRTHAMADPEKGGGEEWKYGDVFLVLTIGLNLTMVPVVTLVVIALACAMPYHNVLQFCLTMKNISKHE